MRKYCQLSQEERYIISGNLRTMQSQAELARLLGRHPSTISRELRRNRRPRTEAYTASRAHSYATARRKRCRRGSQYTAEQWQTVERLLRQKWSPEQISGTHQRLGLWSISHETIYRYVLNDKARHGSLFKHLRIMPKIRRKRYNSKDSRGRLIGKRHISERPLTIEQRLELGHWEADTVMGKDQRHCILTLVERRSGYVIIAKLSARTTAEVTAAAFRIINAHRRRFQTITFDNGTEFHAYKVLEIVFGLTCYFATPYHSWERGTNENTNGLIRQYLPKGTSFKSLTQARCDEIAAALNTRPRKRHGYKTPKEVYDAA